MASVAINTDKKNILLISPCSEKKMADVYFMSPPLGVIRLAGFLSGRGHPTEYYDPNVYTVTGSGPTLSEVLVEKPWDIIGFSCLDETLLSDIENIYLARKLCPDVMLIAGGIEAQFNYQTILDKSPCSIVILGEGEIPLLQLADGVPLHEISGIVFKNKSAPINQELFNEATLAIPWEDLPYEVYWDHYVERYGEKITETNIQEIHTARIFSRNRCPIGCRFCSSTNQLTWGSEAAVPVLGITESKLLEVVKRTVAAHPRLKTIYLTDDDFCIDKRSVERFCELVIKEDFNDLTFMCFARATDLNKHLLQLLKKANFRRLIIGVESFSQVVLDDMDKRCAVDEVHEVLSTCREIGLKPHINIILITPKTTLEDIEISLEWTFFYLMNEYVFCAVIPAIRPLKGTYYHEAYSDYLSEVRDVSGTKFKLQIDEMIWAEDNLIRDIQEKYWYGLKDEIARHVKAAKIGHATGNTIALISLFYMKKLIMEARSSGNLSERPPVIIDPVYQERLNTEFEEYLRLYDGHQKSEKAKAGGELQAVEG